jgi:hypothetical protein
MPLACELTLLRRLSAAGALARCLNLGMLLALLAYVSTPTAARDAERDPSIGAPPPVEGLLPDGVPAGCDGADDLDDAEDAEEPEELDEVEGPPAVAFRLGDATAAPGETFDVPLLVRSAAPLAMIAWTIEFDPGAIEFVSPIVSPEVLRLLSRTHGGESRFRWFIDPEAGFLQSSMVLDFAGREEFSIPAGLETPVLELRFQVRRGARAGSYPLHFTRRGSERFDGNFRDARGPVFNVARRNGRPFSEETRFDDAAEAETDDGVLRVAIIGDVGVFLLGDPNLDLAVDISDPVLILDSLFSGGPPLECPAAADANADNAVDISDPVAILAYLFLGSSGYEPRTESLEGASAGGLGCSP